jgi:hypothetical protein
VSAILKYQKNVWQLKNGDHVDILENAKLYLDGLQPGSRVEWRVYHPEAAWQQGVEVPQNGQICYKKDGFLEVVPRDQVHRKRINGEYFNKNLAQQGGQSFEFRVVTREGQTITFVLHQLYAYLTPREIEIMLRDLEDPDLAWDASEGIPSTASDLKARAEKLQRDWYHFEELVHLITREPHTEARDRLHLLSIEQVQRLGIAALRANARTGLLDSQGRPTGERIYAEQLELHSLTPENGFVAFAARELEYRREVLLRELAEERSRLDEELNRHPKREQGEIKRGYQALKDTLHELQTNLGNLRPISVPWEWHQIEDWHRALSTNRLRFDWRYAAIRDLLVSQGPTQTYSSLGRRQRLLSLGHRKTAKIYEYWVAAITYKALRSFSFVPAPGSTGFRDLEDERGGIYGLKPEARAQLVHAEIPDLTVELVYEPRLDQPGKDPLTPDLELRLSFRGASQKCLVLDAKYRSLSDKNRDNLEEAYSKSALRYRELLGGPNRAVCYLVQIGDYEAWPARDGSGPCPPLEDKDYNFHGGVVSLFPKEGTGTLAKMRRLIVAWLFANRLAHICFYCGAANSQHAEVESFRTSLSSPASWNIDGSYRKYRCKRCNVYTVLTRCCSCKNPIVPIVKIYWDNEAKPAEIDPCKAAPTHPGLRYCPSCGALCEGSNLLQ